MPSINSSARDMSNRNYNTYPYILPRTTAHNLPRTGRAINNCYGCCSPMTDIRKSFCYLITSDFVICTLLWIAFTQVVGMGLISPYTSEVKDYSFETSFFDSVLAALWRMTVLLLAYGLFQMTHSFVCGIMLTLTCAYTICKMLFYIYPRFNHEQDHNISNEKVMVFAFLLIGLTFSFTEILFLHCYVRPVETQLQPSTFREDNERQRLLRQDAEQGRAGFDRFTFRDPDLDFDNDSYADYFSITNSILPVHYESGEPADSDKSELRMKAEECWHEALKIFHDISKWKLEKGQDLHSGLVFSKYFKNYGKIFKLEGFVEASAECAFHELVDNGASSPSWNPTLLEAKLIQKIDDQTDIIYLVAAEAAGGLVKSRDFVNLRHFKKTPHFIFSAGCAVVHPDWPPCSAHVRGENRPGGWAFIPDPEAPEERCKFVFIMNTDLKGWIPQWTVDQALSGTLLNFLKFMRERMAYVKMEQQGPASS